MAMGSVRSRDEDEIVALAYRLLELNPERLAKEMRKLRKLVGKLRATSGASGAL